MFAHRGGILRIAALSIHSARAQSSRHEVRPDLWTLAAGAAMRIPRTRLKFVAARLALAVAGLMATGAALACVDRNGSWPTGARKELASAVSGVARAQVADDMHPYEREARQIGLTVRSFAGMTIDTTTGSAVAFVTDLGDSAAARAAVASATEIPRTIARARGRRGDVVVRSARFRFLDLAEWRDSLLLWREGVRVGVRTLDVDEDGNMVVVGVAKDQLMTATQAIGQRVASVGGKPSAVRVEVADEVRNASPRVGVGGAVLATTRRAAGDSLTSLVRPLRGGIRESRSGCTIGFIVKFDNVFYATTASHCSLPAAYVLPLYLQQGGQNVGIESIDPGPYVFYSPEWHYARWSESTLYQLYDSVSYDFGRVARPINANGSLAIDQTNPYFQITYQETGGISNGWYVFHIGVTTGWHYGYVTKSCKDNYLPEDGYWVHCTFTASMPTAVGDSGGPVLAPYNGAWMTVGMLWGLNGSGYGVFTGWRGLDRDLTGNVDSGRLFSR